MIPTEGKKGGTAAKQAPLVESQFGRAACAYAERFHLSVFPCRPQAKEPLTPHGCKDATRDLRQIADWWAKWPDANVAIACGAISGGLFVLDVDGDEGQESLKTFEATYGLLPKTPQSLTGKGQQFFFKTNTQVKNRVGILAGIDTRTDGGYVIAPPSIHPNGKSYTWEVSARIDEVSIAEVPPWLIELLTSAGTAQYVPRNWHGFAEGNAPCGSRNANLASLAGHLFRKYVDPKIAYMLLKAWNHCCTERPLPDAEFDRTVNSIAKAESARREREA